MSRRPAGLTAFVCILVFGMGGVRADDLPEADVPFPTTKPKLPIAVIELGDFEPNRQLAEAIGRELNNSQELKPLDDIVVVNALRESYEDESAEWIDRATKARVRAVDFLNAYKFPEAAESANNALTQLYFTAPNPVVLSMASELAFLYGVSKLGLRDDKGAADEFRLARSLDATFKPDRVRYLPEIVEAYDRALKVTPPGKGWIGVGPGPGRVFVDGVENGTSPRTIPNITPGAHIVWLVDDNHDTAGTRVVVPEGKMEQANLKPPEIDLRKQIKRARRKLRTAPDPAARAAAMQALARMLAAKSENKVHDAILLTESNGKTIIQRWNQQGLGFSAIREVRPDDKPADLLAPFLPPKKPPPP
jgi:hypothetical protein